MWRSGSGVSRNGYPHCLCCPVRACRSASQHISCVKETEESGSTGGTFIRGSLASWRSPGGQGPTSKGGRWRGRHERCKWGQSLLDDSRSKSRSRSRPGSNSQGSGSPPRALHTPLIREKNGSARQALPRAHRHTVFGLWAERCLNRLTDLWSQVGGQVCTVQCRYTRRSPRRYVSAALRLDPDLCTERNSRGWNQTRAAGRYFSYFSSTPFGALVHKPEDWQVLTASKRGKGDGKAPGCLVFLILEGAPARRAGRVS